MRLKAELKNCRNSGSVSFTFLADEKKTGDERAVEVEVRLRRLRRDESGHIVDMLGKYEHGALTQNEKQREYCFMHKRTERAGVR